MRYFFEFFVDMRGEDRDAREAWWNRFENWRWNHPPRGDEFDARLRYPHLFCVAHAPNWTRVQTDFEEGVPRETLDAAVALVQRFLTEHPSPHPVGFAYAARCSADAVDPSAFIRTGGAITITASQVYEQTVMDSLIAMQERIAKMDTVRDSEELDDGA